MRVAGIITLLILVQNLPAQENIPLGTWRTHFSYNQVNDIVEVGDLIYASSENGLFYFDKTDNSILKISKIDGLQEENISTLHYEPTSQILLIGYESGNLDIISNNEIINFDLVSNSQVLGSKRINHFTNFEDNVFMSTDFGLLKFDLSNLQVSETYRQIGDNAQELKVYQSVAYSDSIFLATDEGVIAANIVDNINLLDYQNWKRFDQSEGIPKQSAEVIGLINNQLFVGLSGQGFYSRKTVWEKQAIFNNEDFYKLRTFGISATIITSSGEYILDENLEPDLIDNQNTLVNDIIIDKDGNLWLATENNGLISTFGANNGYANYEPTGPFSNKIFKFNFIKNQIFGFAGGYSSSINPLGCNAGYYVFEQGFWNNFNSFNTNNPIPQFYDIVDADIVTSSENIYLASIGYGLLRINGDEMLIMDETNSPLFNLSTTARRVIVPAVAKSSTGLWVLNYNSSRIHFLNNEETWQTYNVNSLTSAALDVVPVGNLVWLRIDPSQGGGLVVFDPESGFQRHLTTVSGNGGLPDNSVNAFALDKEDLLWAGTNRGVSVFTRLLSAMEGNVDAIEPIFENRQLLRDEQILDIEVDGGNRKWISSTNGVWLFDDEADEQIYFFNAENSPLPSDKVFDIEIDDNTGEVFFATDDGIISFRADATEGLLKHSEIKIFPNPIGIDFNGLVGITGLANDALIKITDIRGQLVWQSIANGGSASWSVSDLRGNRVETGIYLVFSSTQDGEDSMVGKIVVVN